MRTGGKYRSLIVAAISSAGAIFLWTIAGGDYLNRSGAADGDDLAAHVSGDAWENEIVEQCNNDFQARCREFRQPYNRL